MVILEHMGEPPNKAWGMREAEGGLEDEAELARRQLVLVGPGGDNIQTWEENEKGSVWQSWGVRVCAEGVGEVLGAFLSS